ncbi:MAG: family transporter substrate-binding protein [Streptosporangiaceae bacterium]|nr:family transporter substrate-binding protein [Streptosporangiaceae bacterium]
MSASVRPARPWRVLAAVATAALVGLTAVACSSGHSAASNGDTAGEKTVAFVSPQKAGDNGPTDDMIAALKRAGTDFHVKTKYIEITDPSAFESTLRTLGQAKTDIVVTAFGEMQKPVQAVSKDFPKTRFVLIFGDAYSPALPNAKTVGYDVHQGMYLSGILAASVSTTGTIGYVGGAAIPSLNANYHAYVAGAKSVRPDIQVKSAFAGSFDDPAKGQDIGNTMLASGVDVVQTDAAATSLGVIKAAQQRKALVIADSSGEVAAQYPDTVMGTSFLKFGDSLYAQVKAALGQGWTGGEVRSGLQEGIVGLKLSEPFLNGSSPAAAKVKALQPKLDEQKSHIVDGSVKVPFNTSGV